MSSSPRRDSSKLPWSRSKLASPDTKLSQSEKPSSTKLSLNLFFGFKSKKPSSPVPQDPHALLASPINIKRPPSKSISSIRSRVDSIGPKTPTDGPRESRQSLLTLSDPDPFAGRGVTVVTSPQSAIGHNRYSIYSSNSLPDVGKPESKAYLYSPTSPDSRPLSPDSLPFSSPTSSRAGCNSPNRLVLKKRSVDSTRKGTFPFPDSSFGVVTEEILPKSGSTMTLTDKDRFISALPARTTRARGMTESAMSFVNYRGSAQSSSGSIRSSRGLSRQLSMSRLCSPPTAPPSHGLPPPPTSAADASGDEDNLALTESASSSCLSFASISSEVFLTYSPRNKEKASSSGMKASPKLLVHVPKRTTSHNSFVKPDVPGCSGEYHMDEEKGRDPEEKSPRKQRSFHHPRLPSLPILSRSANMLPMPSSPTPSSPNIDQRRGSNSSLPSRRRLFSGPNRRPSTSQGLSVDDDARSTFSLQSEQNTSPTACRPPWARPSSCSPSIGDDGENDEPSSPQFANKYTPQHIMSPAEMAQVEASMEVVSSPRTRGLSISTITTQREVQDESSTSTVSPVLELSSLSKSSTFPSRKSPFMFSNSEYSHVQPPARPQTSQANLGPGFNEHQPLRPSSSPPLSLMSLPPPPRPRQRTLTGFSSSQSPLVRDMDVLSLQPPPRKTLLAKTSLDQVLRRHSLLRKPSFLEIDDDGDKSDNDTSPGDSFLDLTRESLDANGN
ncbi:hypothetical protein M378DRAFT_238464 [Amanita muscaria Koide BX008]|uniref:Uncharacterized protein n=1 Tax=Amanita muscaria (strain Koide BX008) TaxID=946122 RepID=A0A0C2TWA0_AMAMK|nr:hypothetical protein M378DRAFT_238464 [Amanita muscaria Koide BX008]